MAIAHVRWIATGSPQDDAVLQYAAEQLSHYVRRLTGDLWDARPAQEMGATAGDTAWLGVADRMPAVPGAGLTPAPWDDGFAVSESDGSLYIAGRNPRSVLFGVYAFLESQGVRFLRPGSDGEIVPSLDEVTLPEEPIIENAHYRHRGVCIEGAPSIEHALDMVEWCAKRRLNTVFLQFFTSRYFFNRWYERAYNPDLGDKPVDDEEALALDERLIAAMKQRGIVFHRVGHSWTSATFDMPRSGWVKADDAEVKPEYRRFLAQVNGERRLFGDVPINTEICYSHRPAFDRFVEQIVEYAQEHPELDVVHVWLSDAPNNKCECDGCRPLNISDWYARVINALSQALHERAPGTRFVFLCYFELIWPPQKVEIDESYGNAIMMFAPISRCYAHSLADPDCDDGKEWPRPPLNQYSFARHNSFFVERLAEWRRAFKGDSFDYDYHLMWANWRQLTDTLLARVYHEDLQQLERRGIHGVVSCQSFRAFYPSGLAMATLTDRLWNPDVSWDETRAGYLRDAYGEAAELAGDYLARVESFVDPGDDHWRDVALSSADAGKLAEMAVYLEDAIAELESRQEMAEDAARLRSLELLAHHARLLQLLVQAHQARLAGDDEAAGKAVDAAADFLRRTEPHVSPFMDTELALRLSVELHRPGAPASMF